MRVLIFFWFVSLFYTLDGQIEFLNKESNITLTPSKDRINMLLVVQKQPLKKELEYIDALLAYYNVDLNNIQLTIIRLADGMCSKNDTVIDFGEFKISRKQLNNFIPYKLFIPIPRSKKDRIKDFMDAKLGKSLSDSLFSDRSKILTKHYSIMSSKIKGARNSRINEDYVREISGSLELPNSFHLDVNQLVYKILTTSDKTQSLVNQIDSLSTELIRAKQTIDSISTIKRFEVGINYYNFPYSDNNSVALSSLYGFNLTVKTTTKGFLEHCIGLDISYAEGIKNNRLDLQYKIDGLIDQNGDRFQGNFYVDRLTSSSNLNFILLGISNKLSFHLSNKFESLKFLINPTIGLATISNYYSNVTEGSITFSGNYPQYGLENMTEESLGFGKVNYQGTKFYDIATKDFIPYFQLGVGFNASASDIFGYEKSEHILIGLNCTWLVTQDFRKKQYYINDFSNFRQINPLELSSSKFYLSNILPSISLLWNF